MKNICIGEIIDTVMHGLEYAIKNCPDAQNKTFEELAQWAGQNVLITENDEKAQANCRRENQQIPRSLGS